jgi:hypothetical protein
MSQLVRVAGSRWKAEDWFASGKELAALDEHQVRSWTSWHRWTILALLAHAFLSVLAAAQPAPAADDQLIPLTRNEIRNGGLGFLQAGFRAGPPPVVSLREHPRRVGIVAAVTVYSMTRTVSVIPPPEISAR